MIYVHTHYAAPAARSLSSSLKLTDQQKAIRDFLERHGVKTREIHGKLYAYDEHWDTVKQVHGGEWVNATAWTLQDVRDFLGY